MKGERMGEREDIQRRYPPVDPQQREQDMIVLKLALVEQVGRAELAERNLADVLDRIDQVTELLEQALSMPDEDAWNLVSDARRAARDARPAS